MGKLRSLEMLRGAAALLVVLFHTQAVFGLRTGHAPFGNMFSAGYRGVDLFFVLSGFIIAYVHGNDVGRPACLANYLFNRLARIYPAVWIMTALAAGLYSLGFGGAEKATKLTTTSIIASMMLLPQHGDALVNVTWTLTYEVFFYALFAVVIVNRYIGVLLFLLWQVGTVVVAVSDLDLGFPGYYLRSICLEFSVGLACAWWLRRSSNSLHSSIWFAILTTGIAGFVTGMVLDHASPWDGILCALGAGATILALARLEQARALPVPHLFVLLGSASYAIYLVHFSALTMLAAVLSRRGAPVGNMVCVGCVFAAVVLGLMFDRVVDRPVQRWLRQRKPQILGAELGQTY